MTAQVSPFLPQKNDNFTNNPPFEILWQNRGLSLLSSSLNP
jgi:hypothetical protein